VPAGALQKIYSKPPSNGPYGGVVLKSHKDIVVVAAGAGEFKTLVAAINAVALLRNCVKLCGDSDSKDIDQ
jgi:hypothetical protein